MAAALATPAAASSPVPESPTPTPTPTTSGPNLPSLPSFDPQKVVYQTIDSALYWVDQALLTEMETVWNPLVAGTDNLDSKEGIGGILIDNTKLKEMWGLSLGIATGSLLVLMFALNMLLWLVKEAVGAGHELGRNLVYFLVTVILMATSFFLIQQVVKIDNALVSSVNNQVAIELRSLPAYQGMGLKDPSGIDDIKELLRWLLVGLLVIFVGAELLVLFVIYFVRVILLWVLVVTAPFVLAVSIIPSARGVVVYWLRLLLATVFMKFVNVLVFTTFVFMGAASDVAIMNVLLVFTMLLFMILVPTTIMRALGEPSGALVSVQQTWRNTTHYQPLREAGTRLWSRRPWAKAQA
jgi:hypothetical protein